MEDAVPRQPRQADLPNSDAESDNEDGELHDDDIEKTGGDDGSTPNPSTNSTMSKRKRGNAWKDVVVENALVDSLSKVSTTEARIPKPTGFVDLDNPSQTLQPFLVKLAGGSVKKWGPQKKQSAGGGGKGDAMDDGASTSNGIGGKRKNHLTPKAKRSSNWKGGEKNYYFSSYPELDSEIKESDRLDVASRKAVHQLKEKLNPWTITQVVNHLGNAEAQKLLSLTKTIEQNGGMLTKDGKCRRTAGGVFIALFRSDAEKKNVSKAELKKVLTPPQTPNRIANAAAKQKRALAKRAERRAGMPQEGTGETVSNDTEEGEDESRVDTTMDAEKVESRSIASTATNVEARAPGETQPLSAMEN